MGSNDRFVSGEWNFYCDLCGKKQKSGNGVKTWDGFRVCRSHKEARNPQDFVKGVKDDQSLPWSRHEAPATYVVGTGLPILDTYGNVIFDRVGSAILDK